MAVAPGPGGAPPSQPGSRPTQTWATPHCLRESEFWVRFVECRLLFPGESRWEGTRLWSVHWYFERPRKCLMCSCFPTLGLCPDQRLAPPQVAVVSSLSSQEEIWMPEWPIAIGQLRGHVAVHPPVSPWFLGITLLGGEQMPPDGCLPHLQPHAQADSPSPYPPSQLWVGTPSLRREH